MFGAAARCSSDLGDGRAVLLLLALTPHFNGRMFCMGDAGNSFLGVGDAVIERRREVEGRGVLLWG